MAGDPPPSVSTRSEGETGKTVRRVLVETLIGGGGMVLGAVAGQALSPGGFSGSCSGCAPDYSAGFMLGAGLGSGLGVYGAGTLMGGDGDFLATMAGAGLGAGGAFLLLDAGDGQGRGNTNAFTALLMPLAGAIAGYEISNALSGLSVSPPPRWSRQAPRLVPVASATKDGGVLGGLAGRF